jgi:hypothetical protein
VRDRGRQGAEAHDAGDAREFRADVVERVFREAALRDILNRAKVFPAPIPMMVHLTDCPQVLDLAVRH